MGVGCEEGGHIGTSISPTISLGFEEDIDAELQAGMLIRRGKGFGGLLNKKRNKKRKDRKEKKDRKKETKKVLAPCLHKMA